jgi:fructose/tagatose bisphosphate aldolase
MKQQLQVVLQAQTHSYFSRSLWCNRNFTHHHCAKLLPWIDGLLDASEEHFAAGKPLYSSHMIDLSEEPIENIEIAQGYLARMSKMG